MCCSFWQAAFSKTITGTWEVKVEDKINHVLWYQNNVGSGKRFGWITSQVFEVAVNHGMAGDTDEWRGIVRAALEANGIEFYEVEAEIANRKRGGRRRALHDVRELELAPPPLLEEGRGNCLIIPLLGTWESIRLLNTTDVPKMLDDVAQALEIPVGPVAASPLAGGSYGGGGDSFVFLQFSIYDIVIAQNPVMLPQVLQQINPLKRPKVNEEVFETLASWYQCPVAVCCFNDAESGTAKPLGFAFEPLHPEHIVVYTLDAHDGKAPDPSALVEIDHTIFVGSYLADPENCAKIHYRDAIPDHLRPYVLDYAIGATIRDQQLENGDIVFSTGDVRAGNFSGLRSLPPNGPRGLPRLGHRVKRGYAYQR